MEKYNANQDYTDSARNFQSVPSFDQFHENNPRVPLDKVNQHREGTNYSCADNYRMGSIQDNQIYISTTNNQHEQISQGVHVDADRGLSGYFSDQATVDACKNGSSLDNTKYNEMCQIAPYRTGGNAGDGDATYKPHVDCFRIDRDALFREYGTHDFNAAIAKCEANNQFGAGGGNQGYNPWLSDMIDKKVLIHCPEKSYSDRMFSHSEHNNLNQLTNSAVPAERADQMFVDAQSRAQDCVENNTRHPSSEACKNGFAHNANPIDSNTGHAKIISNDMSNDTAKPGSSKNAGPTPEQMRGADNPHLTSGEATPAGAPDINSIDKTPVPLPSAGDSTAKGLDAAADMTKGGLKP